ncbi:hypothetical protein BOTBODRAFT_47421 [Botryobasidium botryosum FD-172 SS1]|uniref:Uncharacterized protein n=1 Tax=Botryobasidium botryosum (strain FD-172 SS1) TaxID=930990 RepID=A0A067MDB6_BOTB1|nr:hypothetical protein BOTBODRAFT_47421 [Botryobasidium botryosum FD-172 SS1]
MAMSSSNTIGLLQLYLQNLPKDLPLGSVRIYPFNPFAYDTERYEKTEDLCGAVVLVFNGVLDWRGEKGSEWQIKNRGPAVEAIADALTMYTSHPDCAQNSRISPWRQAAEAAYRQYETAPPTLVPPSSPPGLNQFKISQSGATEKHTTRTKSKVPTGGPQPISSNFFPEESFSASKAKGKSCPKTWAWPRNRHRILTHAAKCARLDAELRGEAEGFLAKGSTSVKNNQLMEEEERAAKRAKTADNGTSAVGTAKSIVAAFTATVCGEIGRNRTKIILDHLILRLFCAAGLPPRLVDRDEWKTAWKAANGNYDTMSATILADNQIP